MNRSQLIKEVRHLRWLFYFAPQFATRFKFCVAEPDLCGCGKKKGDGIKMNEKELKEQRFEKNIAQIIKTTHSKPDLAKKLKNYHDNDIAESLQFLSSGERSFLYSAVGTKWLASIISYVDAPSEYTAEIGIEGLAQIINEMDADDAVDLLEKLDDGVKQKLRSLIDDETKTDIRLINNYAEDEIGSLMTTNYVCITGDLTIRRAMHELIRQAGENDNISTIYVADGENRFCGAIDLKDLIIARENDELKNIISYAYPYLFDREKISESIEKIKDYAEDSLPVLNENKKIIGIITAQDVVEMVDDELGEDYARLGGLSAEEDLNEPIPKSIKKRMPWLIILLFLGMVVSSVVGAFENIATALPVLICFQSLILDMAGNVGTQSLAVTIRVLMDENLSGKDKCRLILKEAKIGFYNGGLLGVTALACLGIYIALFKGYSVATAFLISGCVGIALLVSIVISSLVGTLVPMFFHKIKIDPAVSSGPLITTVNDLVAVVTYYGLAWLILIKTVQLV